MPPKLKGIPKGALKHHFLLYGDYKGLGVSVGEGKGPQLSISRSYLGPKTLTLNPKVRM